MKAGKYEYQSTFTTAEVCFVCENVVIVDSFLQPVSLPAPEYIDLLFKCVPSSGTILPSVLSLHACFSLNFSPPPSLVDPHL